MRKLEQPPLNSTVWKASEDNSYSKIMTAGQIVWQVSQGGSIHQDDLILLIVQDCGWLVQICHHRSAYEKTTNMLLLPRTQMLALTGILAEWDCEDNVELELDWVSTSAYYSASVEHSLVSSPYVPKCHQKWLLVVSVMMQKVHVWQGIDAQM